MSNSRRFRRRRGRPVDLGALDGARISGGCPSCDAYVDLEHLGHLADAMHVRHDDWCPVLAGDLDARRASNMAAALVVVRDSGAGPVVAVGP